jgi:hypothetical protein
MLKNSNLAERNDPIKQASFFSVEKEMRDIGFSKNFYGHYFRRFSPTFGRKMVVFVETQYYGHNFT